MSQIEKYAHVLPRMFYTGCTTTIGAPQAGGTRGPQGSELPDDGRRQAHEEVLCSTQEVQ